MFRSVNRPSSQKDPTEKFQKQLQQIIPKCKDIIDKQQKKYLLQIKPRPPTLKAQIKIHKENEPIRPVVNNIQAPTFKLAKFLKKWLHDRLSLPNTYVTYNSTILAHDLTKIKITESSRLATFDIKDLYVNIPIEETVHITKVLLANTKINDNTLTQACLLLETIMKQNYLQFDQKIYQPRKGIAMGSPISGLIAEIFLQYYEQHIIKNNLDSNIITYYNRYVDDILVIYDSLKTNINDILKFMNSI
jgi:hypothetical protein